MLLWQKIMIGLARSAKVTSWMQGSVWMNKFARQFVGGEDVQEGILTARELDGWMAKSSLFYLGEYVNDPTEIQRTVDELEGAVLALTKQELDVHISVDPTQIGAMQSWEACGENAIRLAQCIGRQHGSGRHVLMIDMEDSSVTQCTVDLFHCLRSQNLPVAVTVQAYLHRTADDLGQLVAAGAMVRLVKGAFAESQDVAVVGRRQRDEAYRKAIVTLLSRDALEKGVYPVFGTHDHAMIDFAAHVARVNGWRHDQWEIEMLFGVRPAYQRALVNRGVALRLYVPFGRDWWPYSIRRIGETPKNLGFVLRSLFGRK